MQIHAADQQGSAFMIEFICNVFFQDLENLFMDKLLFLMFLIDLYITYILALYKCNPL